MKQNSYISRNIRGFTVVELLIVIVVIAILAAIAIVAYNGIQERAYVTRVNAGARDYAKALALHVAAEGAYPLSVSGTGYDLSDYCLGSTDDYPAEGVFYEGRCIGSATYNYPNDTTSADLQAAIQQYASGTSAADIKPVKWDEAGGEMYRGYLYETGMNQNGFTVTIEWFFDGTKDCGAGAYSEPIDGGEDTWCHLYLPYVKSL